MKKNILITLCLLILSATITWAQDANFSEIHSNTSQQSRTPEGDRHHYGLWAKDKLMSPPQFKSHWKSAADSIQKRREFVNLCGKAFGYYDEKDALNTVIYGDSALRTGFDNDQIYFYVALSYEQLGDYKQAERTFKQTFRLFLDSFTELPYTHISLSKVTSSARRHIILHIILTMRNDILTFFITPT